MINPASLMKLAGARNQLSQSHPKFTAFLNAVFTRNMLEEGSTIEITVTKADGTSITGNMRVQPEDITLINSLKDLK